MRDRRRAGLHLIGAIAAAVLLIAAVDVLTNALDTTRFSWDFRYYIDMARRGLEPPLASPFAYRFLTPLIVRTLSSTLHAPVEAGFGLLARVAAALQLIGVFLLARWHSKSTRGAWVAMLVTAFSLYNVKFLLFDSFRPDHLAYPLILLQCYLAMTDRFWPLWIVTLVACQVREFNAIPLVAWVVATLWETRKSGQRTSWRAALVRAAISGLGLMVALLTPRLLIPIAEDFQFASLTRDGLLRVALSPLVLARDANFIFSLLAYALPVLMLASPRQVRSVAVAGRPWDGLFLGAYSALVLAFSFLGGTDFYRFSTYLLPPMALILAKVADRSSRLQLLAMLMAVFLFNRIWLPFPNTDVGSYLDFYGGSGTRFNLASVLRLGEFAAFLMLGTALRRLADSRGSDTTLPSQ